MQFSEKMAACVLHMQTNLARELEDGWLNFCLEILNGDVKSTLNAWEFNCVCREVFFFF